MKYYRLFSCLPEEDSEKKQAEIDLSALCENYRRLEEFIRQKDCRITPIAVVKADAYGHGSPACVKALLSVGCDFFAVSCLDEAIAVRQVSDSENRHPNILILGETSPEKVQYLSDFDLIQTLLSEDYGKALVFEATRKNVSVRLHVAADTGMSRIGFPARGEKEIADSASKIASLCQNSCLRVEGAFTHFAVADENSMEARDFTDLQSRYFRDFCQAAENAGVPISFRHICNSAASVLRPQDYLDGVRLGLILYGISPIEDCPVPLQPVMRLTTKITHIHALRAGESLGYGRTYRAPEDQTVATLPIGYADGFIRAYKGATVVLETKTGRHPVKSVGRICMDQCMIDVTGTDASVGDRVVLFGDDDCPVTALSQLAGTIPYESVCLVSSRVLRKYTVSKPKRKFENEKQI